MRLLAPLEVFPALADPLLALQNQVRELVADFQRQKFQ
jgi:hypothetical protein